MNVLILGVTIAAAAAGDGDLISGKVIVALFSAIFAAGGGIWIGRKGGETAAEKSFEKREQEIRAQIANELRTKITNDPLHVQKVPDCISVQECNRKMDALGSRVTELEKKVDAKFNKISEQLEAMDRKSEERAVALHHKMDRIADSVASTGGKVELK